VSSRRLDRIVLALLVLGSAAYLLPLRAYGLMLNDDGWYLHPTLRMLGGEILYRDIWTFYSPLEHHLFAALLAITGPSLLAARTAWVVLLVAGVAATYGVARRLAPISLAFVPAAVFALVPGQWSKAFYTLCSMLFFLALGRFLDRRDARRAGVLGLAVGFSLVTRHDIGIAQLGLAIGALALAVFPGIGRPAGRLGLRGAAAASACFLVAVSLWLVPVLVWYASHDALADLIDATLVRGLLQREGWYGPGLAQLFSRRAFLAVAEGRIVGAFMLLPPLAYAIAAAVLLARLFRRGFEGTTVFIGALLLYGTAGLLNTFYQMRLLRLLETGVPFYLIVTWLMAQAAAGLARRRPAAAPALRAAACGLLASMGLAFVGLIVFVVPSVLPSDDYTGSIRARSFSWPVELFGETFYVDFPLAEELRMLRRFVNENTRPGEPILVGQLHSLYYALLDRPNPTRILGSHIREDKILSDAQKEKEMQRLLASPTRYVLADQTWLAWPEPPDVIRRTLLARFHPIRQYGTMTVLERGSDPEGLALGEIQRRMTLRRATPEDRAALEVRTRAHPDDPLAFRLLGRALAADGQPVAGARALEQAARLDPIDPSAFEEAALLRLSVGQQPLAAEDFREALSVREHPESRRILERLKQAP
jgi:hypothetical protein